MNQGNRDQGQTDSAGGLGATLAQGALLLLIVAIVAAAVILPRVLPEPPIDMQAHLNLPLPPLSSAAGWLNGPAPTNADVAGKLVVAEFWATWCPPCREKMPHMATAAARLRERGVVVLGITNEAAEERATIEEFIASVPGFDWPVAMGAHAISDAIRIERIPTLVLFDQTGTSVWAGFDVDQLEAEVARRLK